MPEEYRNIYQTARKAAGFTQEAAAERLGISTESIRAYENGYRIPSNEVVDLMATCYNAQYLGIQHLRTTNTIAARFVPVITERSLLQVAVQIHVRMSKFDNEQKNRAAAGHGRGRPYRRERAF